MLLFKMLQPDERIIALGRISWGEAKTSGVNRLVLSRVVLNGRFIAQAIMHYLHQKNKTKMIPS